MKKIKASSNVSNNTGVIHTFYLIKSMARELMIVRFCPLLAKQMPFTLLQTVLTVVAAGSYSVSCTEPFVFNHDN